MLVEICHRLFPTCGWIFSSPQEAGSRTASLKRSNQVRGLRHSRSVSCSVKWDSTSWPLPSADMEFYFIFLVYFASIQKIFPHPWNESSSRHLHNAGAFSGDSILNLSSKTSKWRSCCQSWCIESGHGQMHAIHVWISHQNHLKKPHFSHFRSHANF